MTAIIGTYGRTLIFLGLSVPWHSKPAADSPPSHPFLLFLFLSLSLIVPLVFSISIPLFLSPLSFPPSFGLNVHRAHPSPSNHPLVTVHGHC